MLAVVATAQAFSVRPSSLMAIDDPVLALNFDLAATVRARELLADSEEPPVNRMEL